MNTTTRERLVRAGVPLLFTLCCAVGACAQTESLTIGPGDMVHVKVLEAPELEEAHGSRTRGPCHWCWAVLCR